MLTFVPFVDDETNSSGLFVLRINRKSKSTGRPGRKRGCRRYCRFFFSNFYKSEFSIFTYSQIRKLGFQKKSEIFKRPFFRYSPIVNIENLDYKKSEISKHPTEHPAFLIFVNIQIQKLRSFLR